MACLTITLVASPARTTAGPLDPNGYSSLGTLNLSSGSVTFDTDTLTVSGVFSGTGVLQNQGAGLPDIAVFTFSEINLDSAVTLSVVGNRPIAMLSQSDATFQTMVNVSAFTSTGRVGGYNGGASGTSGGGPGGGSPGGGGGFGGAGGGNFSGFGLPYGALSVAPQGGSGGGGDDGPGGAGGGVVEIGALGTLMLSSNIVAAGANGQDGLPGGGGGGSGGGILVHGQVLTGTGTLTARGGGGGDSGFGSLGGGGGGGGRVLALASDFIVGVGDFPSALVVGGASPQPASAPGAMGVAQLMAQRTIIPSGIAQLLGSDGTFVIATSGFEPFQTGDLAIDAGGLAFATAAVTNSHNLQLQGGLVSAPFGWISDGAAQISGFGQLAGPFSGGAGNSISASGGTLVLGDANSTGGFEFGGAITMTDGSKLQLLDSDGAVLQAGGTLTAEGNASLAGDFVNQGTVNGTTGVGQFLTFTDDVSGAGNYTGNILFSDGFNPGNSPAIIAMENVAFDATALLEMELGGLTPGSQHDQLNVSGLLALDGGLNVLLIPGFAPAAGNSFDLFDWATLNGTFTSVQLPGLSDGLTWDASQLYVDGTIAVTQVPEPATLALAALGFAAAAVWHRRRRTASGRCERFCVGSIRLDARHHRG